MTSQQLPNRFADYFIVCGLDVSSGLEPDRLSGDNLHCPPLLRPFKSKVLSHFPDSVPWNPFDKDAVGMLCLPKGLGFATQRDQRQPRFHSFIITREDGSRQCGAAFTFYEEVINKQICTAMQTLHLMFQTEVGGKPKDTQTLAPDSPVPIHRLSGEVKDKQRSYDLNHDKLFVTKCIALITQLPLVKTCNQFLRQLYELTTKPSRPKLPLEAYVYNLLYDIPLPLSGRSLKFFGPAIPLYCQRPGANELPLFDFSLWELFRILGVENFLQVFTCVLLEHQILLYSSDYHRLMLVGEGLCTLAFPFSWQHVYVPILPASLQHFLDAPVPYIMGLLHGQENRSELTLPSEANMCFVDIDANCVEAPEDLPGFPHMADLIEELRHYIAQFQEAMTRGASPRSGPGTPQKSGGPLSEGGPTGSWPNSPKKMEILQQSEAWKKISSIAKKTGVWDSIEGFASEEGSEASKEKEEKEEDTSSFPSRELNELKFNNAIREVFLNRFVHMFLSYEEFVIQPSQDMESWLTNRETMQNFDKASFLSDQPEGHLPFLSPFIETQMFATLIDNKIVSQWEEPECCLAVFDARVKKFLEDCGRQRSPAYVECSTILETESALEKRALSIDLVAAKPQTPGTPFEPAPHIQGFFPALNKDVLNTEPPANRSRIRENAKWRRKDRTLQHAEHLQLNSDQREFALAEKHAQMWLKYIQEARVKNVRQPKLSEMSAAGMAQTNWKFVETLLKECKTKTKKMLVEKMGQEAVELGHGEVSLTGVEENTLIASLCDLLERIWSHGLQTKKGKSALWSHLMNYQEVEECTDSNKAVDPKLLTPDLSALETEKPMPQKEVKTHRRNRSQGRIELPVLRPLPRSVIHDMRKIQQISDIRTDVGMARAWVRLALEKKVLSAHFKELFTDTDLLRSLYKRYAFLRCEDEREQFLYHLLSLNAVDFFCFTNTFHNTVVPYRVLIYPSTKFGCSTTSANPWVCIAGQHGETGILEIPKGCLEFSIEHKNLGVLTTLRIGHDNAGMMPRWLVEYVIVRNELTGHTYKFPCGRWLGKGVDDGSIERLLVAELMPQAAAASDNDDAGVSNTPPSKRSPVSPRKSAEHSRKEKNQGSSIPEIQEYLGHAINNLVKHFYKPEKERGNLTFLLCGEKGLVYCMELVFQCGFRSSRLFRNKMFIWDYLERLKSHFENALANNAVRPVPEVAKAGYWLFCNLMNKINDATETIGKDGKFQIFVCVGVRDHVLHKWLPLMANTTVTGQMYEENSFLRDRSLTNFLVDILGTLTEFPITLEASLLCGLDI